MSKIAVVQESSIFLDKEKTLDKAVALIEKAATDGAELIVFPEGFVPAYPAWIWRLRPGGDWGTSEALHKRLLDNAVDLKAGDLNLLYSAAKKNNITIVCGINERDSELSQATLYNTVVIIGNDGQLLNRHRKLMPTNPERMVWGFGDGSGLNVIETPAGKIGTLLCWENYMPLARYSLYAQGVQIYIAPTYDSGDSWLGTLQHIAREGCCWVIGCGVALTNSDIPDDLPDRASLYPDSEDWINPGDSVVIAPGGEMIAGPLHQQKGILYAEVDTANVAISKRALDVVGHYARPDVFTLQVNKQAQSPIEFS
jgi:nitrilase